MASLNPVQVLETCQITPPSDATESSLPLTFFDTFWLKFHPVERIFFYELTPSTPDFFNSVILHKLKHTLALTLLHFLPLAGKLTWPPNAPQPIIVYTPNDGVPLTVAESSADFHRLSANKPREAVDSHYYIPHLPISDSAASPIALQITLFPHQGFCIGISAHHAILDGKSTVMFMKAWAYLCKQEGILEAKESVILPPELSPFHERTCIEDSDGVVMEIINRWKNMGDNPKSLQLLRASPELRPDIVRGTFEFSREHIKKIKEKVICQLDMLGAKNAIQSNSTSVHLSTFVISFAYTMVCLVKAKGLERDRKFYIGIAVDCRCRLDSPVPANYFGNCVSTYDAVIGVEDLMEENYGIAFAAYRLSELIKGLDRGVVEGMKRRFENFWSKSPDDVKNLIGVAGSPRFEIYGTDFGWGRPRKVEVTSIDKSGSFSMAECKDGSGGVEVGVVLKKNEMEIFDSLFSICYGVKDL